MDGLYTEELVSIIKSTVHKYPAGWRLVTDDSNEYYLILDIPMAEFEKFSLTDRIRIAEVTNELCERIKKTGIPCVIQKV